jgi:hypothetical protein
LGIATIGSLRSPSEKYEALDKRALGGPIPAKSFSAFQTSPHNCVWETIETEVQFKPALSIALGIGGRRGARRSAALISRRNPAGQP